MVKAVGAAAFACGTWDWHALLARAYNDDFVITMLRQRRSLTIGSGNGRLSGGLYAKGAR